jgi:predicted flavoprotein YhiN
MGVSALASVKVKNSKLKATGPLLITHWGMSGPGFCDCLLGVRELAERNYQFVIEVNWLNDWSVGKPKRTQGT